MDTQKLIHRLRELQEENDNYYETITYLKDVIEGLENELDELQNWNEYLEHQNNQLKHKLDELNPTNQLDPN